MSDTFYMEEAIKEAQKAIKTLDVPIGCVIVCNGKIIAKARNKKEKHTQATFHAELLAIQKASKKLKRWRLLQLNHKIETVFGVCEEKCSKQISDFFRSLRSKKAKW